MSEQQAIWEKLEKLRAFAERGNGPEEMNARRLIEHLIKRYDIHGFKYTPYEANDDSNAKQSTKSNASNAHNNDDVYGRYSKKNYPISYTSLMRDVVYALGKKLNIPIVCPQSANKLFAYCTPAEWTLFSAQLKNVKKYWKSAVAEANRETIDAINKHY